MLNYERGLEKLQEIVQRQKPEYLSEFGVFQSRLLEYLQRERRYGQSSNNDADRNEVLDRLTHFANEHFAIEFIELCRYSGIIEEPLPERNAPTAHTYEEIWKGGSEIFIKGSKYIIHEPVEIHWTLDRSARQQQARALQVGVNRITWLRQVQVHRATASAEAWKIALEKEARLLDELEQKLPQNFPRCLDFESATRVVTLVYHAVQGQTWSQNFYSSNQPLNQRLTRTLLWSAVSLCETLKTLHARQAAHRFLTPDKIFLLDGRRALLQDTGLATWKYEPNEGPEFYRAPEQAASHKGLVFPGPQTDVYQLGRILYHYITGRMPASPHQVLPLRTWNNALSVEQDAVLQRTLAFNGKERWRSAVDFSSALRRVL